MERARSFDFSFFQPFISNVSDCQWQCQRVMNWPYGITFAVKQYKLVAAT